MQEQKILSFIAQIFKSLQSIRKITKLGWGLEAGRGILGETKKRERKRRRNNKMVEIVVRLP